MTLTQLVEKVRDIVGLYMNPPDHAMVLCIDEKSQIQALNRTQPLLPMRPASYTLTLSQFPHGNHFAMHRPHSASIWLEAEYDPLITNPTRPELWVIERNSERLPPAHQSMTNTVPLPFVPPFTVVP
jgi:hypothetical protein